MKINLRDILQAGQIYVAELSEELGLDVKVVKHEFATDTCFEKADLLGWESNRVVKAVFFHREDISYGFIFPELGTKDSSKYINKKEVFPNLIGCSRKEAKNFKNSYCPSGMEKGTCTPFVLEDSFEKGLERLFIYDIPQLDDQLVDISMGGYGEEAHKTSLHLPYKGIYKILNSKFGDKINKFNNI